MFNFVLFILFHIGLKSIRNNSKPTTMFLTPTTAKTELMDEYLTIQAMPDSKSKQRAYKKWQKKCQSLELTLNPKLW